MDVSNFTSNNQSEYELSLFASDMYHVCIYKTSITTTGSMYFEKTYLISILTQNKKRYTVYNGIYYTLNKNTWTSQCRKWNSIICRDGKLYQLGSKFIKKEKKKNTGSFRFKAMNSHIYSIHREVSLKSSFCFLVS